MAKNELDTGTLDPQIAQLAVMLAKLNQDQLKELAATQHANTLALLDSIRNPPMSDKEKAMLERERIEAREARENGLRNELAKQKACDHLQGMNGDSVGTKTTWQRFHHANGNVQLYCKKCGKTLNSCVPEEQTEMLRHRASSGAVSRAAQNPTIQGDPTEVQRRMLPRFEEYFLKKKLGEQAFQAIYGPQDN